MKAFYDLRAFSINQYLRAFGGLLAGLVYCLQVSAQVEFVDSGNTRTINFPSNVIGGSGTSFTYTPGSSAGATQNPNLSGWTTAGNYGVSQGATGVTAATQHNYPLPGGRSVPVTVASKIKPLALAKGLVGAVATYGAGGAAGGAVGAAIGGALGVGVALYDLFKGEGFEVAAPTAPGVPAVVTKNNPLLCTVAPCYNYRGNAARPWFPSPQQGCQDWAAANGKTYIGVYGTPGAMRCQATGSDFQMLSQSRTVDANVPLSSSLQELEDAIAAKSGWPTTTFYAQNAVKDALNRGQNFEVEAPVVSGPASTTGSVETTQQTNAQGQPETVTKSTVYNTTYQGNTINHGAVTTTNVTNNTTNVTTTTTVTSQPVTPKEEADICAKNPDTLGCKKVDFDVPEGEIPKTTKNITFAAEDLGFGGGTCPADVLMTPHGMTVPIKMIDWASSCNWITNYARPIILALATFTALMIIFVGGKPE